MERRFFFLIPYFIIVSSSLRPKNRGNPEGHTNPASSRTETHQEDFLLHTGKAKLINSITWGKILKHLFSFLENLYPILAASWGGWGQAPAMDSTALQWGKRSRNRQHLLPWGAFHCLLFPSAVKASSKTAPGGQRRWLGMQGHRWVF